MSDPLQAIPVDLRGSVERAASRFWVEQMGRPPVAEDGDLSRQCRVFFLLGAAQSLDLPVADLPLLHAAFFAGHAFRVRAKLAPAVGRAILDASRRTHEMGCPAEGFDEDDVGFGLEFESEQCDCGLAASRERAFCFVAEVLEP